MKAKEKTEDYIDFIGLINRYLKRWYWFALTLIIAYAFAKVYINYSEPIYRVSATILAKDEASGIKGINLLKTSNDKNLTNEIGTLRSFDMILRVISELDFDISYFHAGKIRAKETYQNSPYQVSLDSNSYQVINVPFYITILNNNTFKIEANGGGQIYDVSSNKVIGNSQPFRISKVWEFGKPFKEFNISFTLNLRNPFFRQEDSKLYFVINDRTTLANIYRWKLGINQVSKESSILELSSSGPVVEKDINFLNKVADVYIQSGLEEKNRISINTIKFIDEQLAGIADTLKLLDKKMEVFKASNKTGNLEGASEVAYEKLEVMENQKSSLNYNIRYYNYILDYIKNNKDFKDIVAPSVIGIADPVLGNLIGQLLNLKAERSQLENKATTKNPYLINIDNKIQYTIASLEENLSNIIKGTELQIKDINNRIASLENKIYSLPLSERLFLDIQRKYDLNDNIYNFLLQKRAEAGIAKASNQPDARVLDEAKYLNSYQIEPKGNLIMTSSLMIGFAIPLIIFIVLDFLNNKVGRKEDIESITNIPILGIIGHSENKSNLVILEKPKSGIAEAFRSIRININYFAPEKEKKVIAITSSISGEGKTFCSINLASIIALSGKKTVLIGADLRKPKIIDDFSLSNINGLSTFLSKRSSIDEIIQKTKIQNLDIIPAGPIPPNPAELLGEARLGVLIDELKERYDYVILDTPPIGLVADSFLIMKYSDVNVYIVRHKYTEARQLEKIDHFYEEGKVKDIGIIINDLVAKDAKYGYGYEYGYGYYSGYGYYEEENEGKSSLYKKLKRKFVKS